VGPATMSRYLDRAQALQAPLVRTMYARFGETVPAEVFEQNVAAAGDRWTSHGVKLLLDSQSGQRNVPTANVQRQES
jgi:hypothetical protein